MDGLKQQHKQIESFQFSGEAMNGHFPNRLDFPRYSANGPFNISGAYVQSIDRELEIDSINDATYPVIGLPQSYSYGCVQAPNGLIFMSSGSLIGNILVFNTSDLTMSTIGSGLGEYAGGVLYKDKVYIMPRTSSFIIEIDWDTRDFRLIPHGITSPDFIQGILAPNGWIYIWGGAMIYKFNPSSKEVIEIIRGFASNSWTTAVMYKQFLFGAPFNATTGIRLNTDNDNIDFFGSISGSANYFSGALGFNGKIYFAPEDATNVLKLDPEDLSMNIIGGSLGSVVSKYRGLYHGPDGRLYGIPSSAQSVLKIDPVNDSVSTFGSLAATVGKWYGGCLSLNGDIYGVPQQAQKILRLFSSKNKYNTNKNPLISSLNRYFNRL